MTSISKPYFLYNEYTHFENGVCIYDDDAPEDIKEKVDAWNNKVREAGNQKLI